MNVFDSDLIRFAQTADVMSPGMLGGLLGPATVGGVAFGNQVPVPTAEPLLPVMPMGMMGPENLMINNTGGPISVMPDMASFETQGLDINQALGALASPTDRASRAPSQGLLGGAGLGRMSPWQLQYAPRMQILRR